jgi:hypothetical protein
MFVLISHWGSPRGLDRLAPLQQFVGPMRVDQHIGYRHIQKCVGMLGVEFREMIAK